MVKYLIKDENNGVLSISDEVDPEQTIEMSFLTYDAAQSAFAALAGKFPPGEYHIALSVAEGA
jgi:hypothetical protein